MPREQDRVLAVHPAGDDADRLDDRDRMVGELPQKCVLMAREPRVDLLEREDFAFVADEAHDVAADSPRDVDDPVRVPFLERQLPRQIEEVRRLLRRHELKAHVLPR